MQKRTPIYIQIHNQLREMIRDGYWKVGDRIPSERDLAIRFDVSRMTVRQAVQTLVEEGILERRVGAGTFVSAEKVQEKMSTFQSFTEIISQQGQKPSSKVVSYHVKPASNSEAEKLHLEENAEVLQMERIRYADGTPICLEVASIPYHMVSSLSKKQVTQSLYHTLETEKGISLERAEQTISATLASERVAELLDMKRGEAILRLRQVSYSKDNTPFEYVRTQYAGERFEFYVEGSGDKKR
ncbi:GntR family transcriptional regulator [Atopococcus tabaci]|uniref:GntR family transcriptional regulator n=1 Tax=Atopococcus tabaci TaxID=269774 RepID=UPI0024099875|nr:GntR family transcriptional regulator [Atopococcus tabaci]